MKLPPATPEASTPNALQRFARWFISEGGVPQIGQPISRLKAPESRQDARHDSSTRPLEAMLRNEAFPITQSDSSPAADNAPVTPAAQEAPALDKLRTVFMWGNWGVNRRDLPHYLIPGRAEILEPLLERVVTEIQTRAKTAQLGWVWDAENEPGTSRALRVVDALKPGHKVVGDVYLYARHGDLYLRHDSLAWTRIKLLTRFLGTFSSVMLLSITVYGLWHTNAFRIGWVKDIAKKYAPTDSVSETVTQSSGTSSTGTSVTRSPSDALERLICNGYRSRPGDTIEQVTTALLSHRDLYQAVFARYNRLMMAAQKEVADNNPFQAITSRNATRDGTATPPAETAQLPPDPGEGFVRLNQLVQRVGNQLSAQTWLANYRVHFQDATSDLERFQVAIDFCLRWEGVADFTNSLPPGIQQQVATATSPQIYTPIQVLEMLNDPAQRGKLRQALEVERQSADLGAPAAQFQDFAAFKALALVDFSVFFVTVIKGPGGAIVALWLLFMVAPKPLLKLPCLLFRWPLPQTFDNAIVSHNAALQAIVGGVLLRSFRITDKDRIPVHTKR